jgi:hypothetical protein
LKTHTSAWAILVHRETSKGEEGESATQHIFRGYSGRLCAPTSPKYPFFFEVGINYQFFTFTYLKGAAMSTSYCVGLAFLQLVHFALAVAMPDMLYPEHIRAISIQSKRKASALGVVQLLERSAISVYRNLFDSI